MLSHLEVDPGYEAWVAEWMSLYGEEDLRTFGEPEEWMAQYRKDGPYVWVSWLAELLSGDRSCEWAGWFKAQHESSSWESLSSFDSAAWKVAHTALLKEHRSKLVKLGYDPSELRLEGQNSFVLKGRIAVLAGKPDLVAMQDETATVIDIKSGKPKASHAVQVMLYMYALPVARKVSKDVVLHGRLVYPDHEIEVPFGAVDEVFKERMARLIERLASSQPAVKVPSVDECRFCPISSVDCPERIDVQQEAATTDDF